MDRIVCRLQRGGELVGYRWDLCRPCCNESGVFAVSVRHLSGSTCGRIYCSDDVDASLQWTYDLSNLNGEYDAAVYQPRHLAFDTATGDLYVEVISCESLSATTATIQLLKLNSSGVFQWITQIGTIHPELITTLPGSLKSVGGYLGINAYGRVRVYGSNCYFGHPLLSTNVWLTKVDSSGNLLKSYSGDNITFGVDSVRAFTDQDPISVIGERVDPYIHTSTIDEERRKAGIYGFDIDIDGNIWCAMSVEVLNLTNKIGGHVFRVNDETDKVDWFSAHPNCQSQLTPGFVNLSFPHSALELPVAYIFFTNGEAALTYYPAAMDIACSKTERKVWTAGAHDPGLIFGGNPTGNAPAYHQFIFEEGSPPSITSSGPNVLGSAALGDATPGDVLADRLTVGRKGREAGGLTSSFSYPGAGPFGQTVTFDGIPQLSSLNAAGLGVAGVVDANYAESDGGGLAYVFNDRIRVYSPFANEYEYPVISGVDPQTVGISSYRILG